MKITKKIAAATLVSAAAVGISVSGLAIASAGQPSGDPHAGSRHAQAGQRHSAQHQAKAAATPAPKPPAHHKAADPVKGQAAALNRAARHSAHKASHQARGSHKADGKAHHKAAAKPAPAAAAPSPVSMFAGMSAFERCVAWRESGDNPEASSAGLFGILPSTWASLGYPGTAGTSSVELQKQAFDRLYAMDGTSPWAPYDGC
jgi:hypothetical protein